MLLKFNSAKKVGSCFQSSYLLQSSSKKKVKKQTTIDLEKSTGCLISVADINDTDDIIHLNIDLDLPSQNKEDIVIEAKNNDNNETTIIHIKTDSLEKTQEEIQQGKES